MIQRLNKSSSYVAKDYYRNRDVAEEFDKVRFRSAVGRFVNRLELRTALKLATDSPDVQSVLDAPCGTARLMKAIATNNNTVWLIGADVSLNAIRIGKGKLAGTALSEKVQFVNCDIERLPFRDDSFDSIVSMRLMGHIPQNVRESIVGEFMRISRKRVILEHNDPVTLKGLQRALLAMMGRKDLFWFPLSVSRATREMREKGFSDFHVERILGRVGESYFIRGIKNMKNTERL